MNFVQAYLAVSLLCLLVLASCMRSEGVELRLTNVDIIPLDSLRVKVTGNTYDIERIEPGKTTTIYINPTGESDILLLTPGGKELLVGVYIEQNYTGTVKTDIKADSVITVIHDLW